MKKGLCITKVYITGSGIVTAYDNECHEVKLTRFQRNLFTQYESPDEMIELINKEFGNSKILSKDFFIAVDDTVVFDMATD